MLCALSHRSEQDLHLPSEEDVRGGQPLETWASQGGGDRATGETELRRSHIARLPTEGSDRLDQK